MMPRSTSTESTTAAARCGTVLLVISMRIVLGFGSSSWYSSSSSNNAFFVEGFASPQSPRQRQRISVQLSTRKNKSNNSDSNSNKSNCKPQSRWSISNSAPYTPSGLTPQQYSAIKKREADELSSKNLGAWGPRFNSQSRPDGDWMVMSSLWTRGFDSNAPAVNGSGGVNGEGGARNRVASMLRVYRPAFVLSYIVAAALYTCIGLTKAALSGSGEAKSISALLKVALRLVTIKQPVFLAAAASTASAAATSATTTCTTRAIIAKNVALQSTIAAILTQPLIKLVGYMNRKRSWSARKTMACIGMASVGLILSWIGLLFGASNLYVFASLLKLG